MDNIKISATFKIRGSVMYQEKDKEGKPLHYNVNTMELYDENTNHTDVVKVKTSKCKPCIQSINMSKEAYQNMINNPTSGISPNHWKRMSENQRIAEHLKELQNDLDAISFEFTVFDD